MKFSSSILGDVGNTPLVKLNCIGNGNLYAKLENLNPSGSVKDRVAKKIVESAEERGELTEIQLQFLSAYQFL